MRHRQIKTEKFKFELDKKLKLIPYEPKMSTTQQEATPSLTSYLILGLKQFTKDGGVPHSAKEQA